MSEPREPAGTVPRWRSWSTMAGWGLVVAVLALLGRGLEARLAPMSLAVPGTPSSRAEAMLASEFGNTVPVAVLLRGPPRELDRQGRRLVAALRGIRQVQVLSPWDGDVKERSLRPHPGAAFVLVNYIRPASRAMTVVSNAERVIGRTVRAPVHSYLTGVAVIGHALQETTMAGTQRAEMIALPVLILVLLLVFRSPVAAAVPLAMGAATVMAGHGLLWLASFVTPINPLGVAIAAMMSLALGVDYALLMVSRVREELASGRDHQTAVAITTSSAGRTIIAAGGTLALTMLAASAVATPGMLGPVAIGVVISGLLSVALALTAMPALLRLLGPTLDRWEIRLTRTGTGSPTRAGALAERLIAHPAITVPLILAGMLALAAPAGALRMGPPDASELPASSPARIAVRMVERTIGPGWPAPFVIVASARSGAITTQQRLRTLIRWQERIAGEPDVAAVLGPASVAGAQHELDQAHAALASAPTRLGGAQHGINDLRSGLNHASAGVRQLRHGLASAAAGAGSLGEGAGRAESGGERLAAQTGRASAGAERLGGETGRASAGARRLGSEAARGHKGARRLASESARAGDGAKRLQSGIGQAARGSAQLAGGIDQAAGGAQRLAGSDGQLTSGAAQLAGGMDTLDNTVHAILTPIEVLAEQLHGWAGWILALQASDQQLRSRLEEATHELDAMTLARSDPRYPALARDLAAITQLTEQDGLAQLARIRQQLLTGLQRLAELPAQLSQLTGSLDSLRSGADRLATGTSESERGALALDSALSRLATDGHTLSAGLTALNSGASKLATGLGKLTNGNTRLATGLGKLTNGNTRLATGLGKLTNGNTRLATGLGKLSAGDAQLANGLGKLVAGDEQLAGGLSAGQRRAGTLSAGLDDAQRPLRAYARMLNAYQQDYRLLHADAPNALDSGYLVLTALDGTASPTREQIAQLVNVDGGGQATRMMVIASSPPDAPATAALSRRLQRALPALAAATASNVQIGQGAQYLLDYTNANTTRFPLLVLALALVATFTLIVVLRALLLPLIAVVLNLATIAVALGVLELLTREHVLGGPGYIDAASGAGILSIMFVLSIDYEVFLLTRIREQWLAVADADSAIRYGLRHTARIITGSAAIMAAVFLAFGAADVIPLRQFGVGLTIAVLLDATIVRLVLLPAIMRAAGPRIWWLPAWLDRTLPSIEQRASD